MGYFHLITVLRQAGFRFVIFVDDHEPAHVHVFGDGELKINLSNDAGIAELVWAVGMTRSDVRAAMRIVNDNQASLLKRWKQVHD